MIRVGTKVSITDITDYFLQEGIVKEIKKDKAVIKFPGKPGAYVYALDDLEEIEESVTCKAKKKQI